jgi:hypothetical protein
MSYSITIEAYTGRDWYTVAEVGNYTMNVSPMWRDALGGQLLREYHEAPCSEAAGPLAAAVERMETDPDRYQAMNPPNGWGDYDGALEFLRKLRDACVEHPAGRIWISA